MKDEEVFKKVLIDFIKANSKNHENEDLENRSVTELTILKTEIEIRLHFSKKKK